MKTLGLALLLTATTVGTAAADDRFDIVQKASEVMEDAGRVSSEMGRAVSRAITLGGKALSVGMSMDPNQALHMESDKHGVDRLWSVTVGKDTLHAGKVISVGEPFTDESAFTRDIQIERKGNKPRKITSIATYNPRGAAGKTWIHKTTVTKRLFGVEQIEKEVLRRTVENGGYKVKVMSHSVTYQNNSPFKYRGR
jgi:hypothetical protein